MDVVLLSRIQFAFTIMFHYIFPPINIGLGVFIVIMEGLYLKTKNPLYEKIVRFWIKIFGLTFAVGVATGIVMEFEFGTNWATYSRFVGDVFGSALAAEGIFAFFLESGFLAILLFGWDRVSPKFHFISAVLVMLGAHFSAVWIVVANSWQQTPAGYHIVGEGLAARAEITDFWAMVFNPSSVERLIHVILGCWMTGAFLVLSVSAFYLLKKKHLEFAKTCMKVGLFFALGTAFLQVISGHDSAVGVSRNQPAKLAAAEAHYAESAAADLYLFGWVNDEKQTVTGIKLPKFLTFLIHQDFQTPVTGLNAFPEENRPPVNVVFQAYHLMVGLGFAMMGLAVLGLFYLWRGRLWETGWLLKIFVAAVVLPHIAQQAGWFVAEVGRQPWVVYGLLRTADAHSAVVNANQVLGSLIMFAAIYALLFALFIFLLDMKIKKGPEEIQKEGIDDPANALKGQRA